MFRKHLLSASILLPMALVGCGGSSSDGSVEGGNTTTFTVIDGYINSAEICVAESPTLPCVFEGKTNSAGEINIPEKYVDHLVIATVKGGVSSDSDTVGLSSRTYTMVSNSGINVVTPFTTMATLDETRSLDDIAHELGLAPEAIAGDYVKTADAETHLLARTLTRHLEEDVTNTETAVVFDIATKVVEHIEGLKNNDEDLSNIVIDVDVNEDGTINNVENHPRIATLEAFLERTDTNGIPEKIYMASMNTYWFVEDEGVFEMTYSNGTVSTDEGEGTYEINGDILKTTFDEDEAEFNQAIYISNEFGLLVDETIQDVSILSIADLSSDLGDFKDSDFIGKTLYAVSDDSTSATPKPTLMELVFNADNTVDILENDGTMETAPWEINSAGALEIRFLESDNPLPGDDNLVVKKVTSNKDGFVVADYQKNYLILFLYDKNFATKIFNDWGKFVD